MCITPPKKFLIYFCVSLARAPLAPRQPLAGVPLYLGPLKLNCLIDKCRSFNSYCPLLASHIGSRCLAMAYYHFARRRVFQLTIAGSATRCLPQTRSFSTPATTSPHTRWLSDLKARLGKCIIFGLPKEQVRRAGQAAKILGEEWRGLIAGREGYLIDSGHEGIVRWGEMVCRTEKKRYPHRHGVHRRWGIS